MCHHHSLLAIGGHTIQALHLGCSLIPGPHTSKKVLLSPPLPQGLQDNSPGKAGYSEKMTLPNACGETAKTFLKAMATELLERTPWWAQFVCSQDPPCPHSLFLPHCDAEDSTVKIIRVNSLFSIILWGKEPWIQNHKVGGVWALVLTLRKPFHPAESRLTHLWKAVKESNCLPNSVSLQQGEIIEMKALGKLWVP